MSMPPSIASIINVVQPYKTKAPGKRPSYVKTLAGGLEIEIKIPIYNPEKDILAVMNNLLPHDLCGAEHRSETHYVYALENGAHLSRITIKNSDEVWLKKKTKNTPITTSRHKLPAVCRVGEKLNVGNPRYDRMYKITTTQPLKVQFEKECLNFFYTYEDCVFSLSFSLAWSNTSFLKQEMEVEYEGHVTGKPAPSHLEVEELLETMFMHLIPGFLHSRVHAETKYESLQQSKK